MDKKYLIIVMGVSGSGKTTIARHISENTGFKYIESDQFHSPENIRHMKSGLPLTDEMRWPWIEAICTEIKKCSDDIVLANSGLKQTHRTRFMDLDREVLFIHLQVPRDILLTRMKLRTNHFMPASLLDSQFEALEMPNQSEPVFNVDGGGALFQIAAASLTCVENILRTTPKQ